MAEVRAELRAFPRMACAHAAVLEIGGIVEDCQLLDLSRGGCKVMPRVLQDIVQLDLRPHAHFIVIIDDLRLGARLAWATPNCSALGCAFDVELTEDQLRAVTGQAG